MAEAIAVAERQEPAWKTIAVRLPANGDSSLSVTVDRGNSGQPQFRTTLTMNRETGAITKAERFSDQNLGRRTRSWLRFIHTGEYYGIAGQTIAGLASGAGGMLVVTGFALSFHRLSAWIKRRKRSAEIPVLSTANRSAQEGA